MEPLTEYRLKKLILPVDDYLYTVKTWRSVDNGKTFVYCGESKYFKTEAEAAAYTIEQIIKLDAFNQIHDINAMSDKELIAVEAETFNDRYINADESVYKSVMELRHNLVRIGYNRFVKMTEQGQP